MSLMEVASVRLFRRSSTRLQRARFSMGWNLWTDAGSTWNLPQGLSLLPWVPSPFQFWMKDGIRRRGEPRAQQEAI